VDTSFDDRVEGVAGEIARLWRGRIAAIRPELVNPALPLKSRDLLTAVGLPTENCWHIEFFHDEALRGTYSVGGRDLAAIADDHGTPIVVDVSEGSVWSVIPGVPQPLQFVNSDLPAFLYALGRYDAEYGNLMRLPPAERNALVSRLKGEFMGRDPESMSRGGAMWRYAFAQAAQGSP